MKRTLLTAAAVAVPLVTGLLLSLLFELERLPNHLLVGEYVADFSGIASRVGLLLTLAAALIVGGRRRHLHAVAAARRPAQVEHAEAQRRFLQRLDHELKNPLTIIRLGIVNLQHAAQPTGAQRASLDRIGQQVQRLGRLIIDLRWLSELEEHNIEQRPVAVNRLLSEVIAAAEEIPDYARRPVDLSVQQAPWPVAAVWGDRDLLTVVFRNLLDNALKYTCDGDRVEIRVFDDGQAVIVEIADTGPGIPESQIPLIFEELYRGENARTISGSGLGLALVQRIVALHHGLIRVRSRVGHGTAVTVRLPPAPEPPQRSG